MSLSESYTREIRRQLNRFATWEPGLPVRLGDYGELRGSQFVRIGNVGDPPFSVSIASRRDDTHDLVSYASEGAVAFEFGSSASGDVGPAAQAKANVSISMSSQWAVMFNAADVAYELVADHAALEREILHHLESGAWRPRHVIVTELMHSGSTTILVSSASAASVLLEADADIPTVDLADAAGRLSLRSSKNIGYKAVTADGMTPLLGLSRVRPKGPFWWRRTELRRQLGFEPAGDEDADAVPHHFQALLDEHEESLRDQVRAMGVATDEAFEWNELQPVDRPATN